MYSAAGITLGESWMARIFVFKILITGKIRLYFSWKRGCWFQSYQVNLAFALCYFDCIFLMCIVCVLWHSMWNPFSQVSVVDIFNYNLSHVLYVFVNSSSVKLFFFFLKIRYKIKNIQVTRKIMFPIYFHGNCTIWRPL